MDKFLITIGKTLAILIIAGVIGFLGYEMAQKNPPLGSVSRTSEYRATTTESGTAAGLYTITSAAGTLGSIVITSSTAGTFTVYDADAVTSTATTTLAVFEANALEGTYTFDRVTYQGIKILVPSGYNGNIITTYR